VNRILKPFVFLAAAIYFLMDGVFLPIARPAAQWLSDHWILGSLRRWIESLSPYATLALFMVPVLLLEPVKPLAAYLTATDHIKAGIAILIVGEILKLVLVERLFSISRDKLMSIRAFAWCYDRMCRARRWAESFTAWQQVRRLGMIARYAVREYMLELKLSRKQQRLSWQSH
jgi:hypothetical protein